MESVEEFRRIIRAIITHYAQFKPSVGEVEVEVVFDETNDHYELIQNGWIGAHRIEGSVIHIDIRDGKIWIQHDGIADGVANELVAAGVPHERIVLAFKHPHIRPHTGFAVA